MAVARWWWVVVVAVGSLGAASRIRQDHEPDWLSFNGSNWRRLEPNAQWAYVQGFLAGAALGQATQRVQDSAGVSAELDQLRRSGGLRLPYGANVYASRINDYYWWKDHLPLPTWHAFLEVNATLSGHRSDSVP